MTVPAEAAVEVTGVDPSAADELVDLWVALARGQREHDSHLLAEANRTRIRELFARYAANDRLLVARAAPGALDGIDSDAFDGADADALDGADTDGLDGADADALDGADTDGLDGADADALDGADTDGLDGADSDALDGADGDGLDGADADVLDGATDTVGFVMFRIRSDQYEVDCSRGLVENLYVVPDCRGAGIGSALLSAAERRLRERGAEVISLESMAANEDARRFYRRHGYEPHRIEFEKSVDDGT